MHSKLFTEEELIPISALQHLLFCKRQWALIHLEQIWRENKYTVEGHLFHEKVDSGLQESRRNIKISRGIKLRSLVCGITGISDLVKFYYKEDGSLERCEPIEYKLGKPKTDLCDAVQLCAQALCLEEMLKIQISKGFLFYGKIKKSISIEFDTPLRKETTRCIKEIRELTETKKTPLAIYTKKCKKCSLVTLCMPKQTNNFYKTEEYLSKAKKWLQSDCE